MPIFKIKILTSTNSMDQIKVKLNQKIEEDSLPFTIVDSQPEQQEEEQQEEEQQEEVPNGVGTSQDNSKNLYIASDGEQTWTPSSSDVKSIKITLQAGGGGGGVGFISQATSLFNSSTNINHDVSPSTFDIGFSGTGGSSGESFSTMMNINYDPSLSFTFKVGSGGSGEQFDPETGIKTDATSGESTWFKVTGSSQYYETKGGVAALPRNPYLTTADPWRQPIEENSNSKIGNNGIVFPLDMESYLNALINESFTSDGGAVAIDADTIINELTWTLSGSDTSSISSVIHDPSEAPFIVNDHSVKTPNRGLKQLIQDYISFTSSEDPNTVTSSAIQNISFDTNDLFAYFNNLRGNSSNLASHDTGGRYIGGGAGGGSAGGAGGSGYTVDTNFLFEEEAHEGKSGKSGGGGGGGGVNTIDKSTPSSSTNEKIYYSTNGGNGGDGYIIIEESFLPI